MAKTLHALDYLAAPKKHPARPVCVLYGDEAFLKREAMRALRRQTLGDEDGEVSLTVLAGAEAVPRDVFDELSTRAMFGPSERMVVIEQADPFVTEYRSLLEDYVAREKLTGVLVLEVKTWPGNTRLAKAVAATGLPIECKPPTPARLRKWLVARAKTHGATLAGDAADMLLELIEPEAGLLDQELARLALLAGDDGAITADIVTQNVGSWRTKTTWDLIDAAAAGDARDALLQLDRLILAGEHPIALLAQIGSTLRRFAAATRAIERDERAGRRVALRSALADAGVKPFALGKSESQLRQIGRARGGQLYRWLLETDLALKGESSAPARARLELELLLVRLSKAADPRNA